MPEDLCVAASTVQSRRHPRLNPSQGQRLRLTLEKGTSSPETVVATIVDLGDGGLGVETARYLPIGIQVSVAFAVISAGTKREIESRARVCWCAPSSNTAFRAGLSFVAGASPEDDRRVPEESAAPKESEDYYEILQVSRSATPDTIHRVYRILAQQYHPDNAQTGNEEAFLKLVRAYKVLSDPVARAAYDVELQASDSVRWKVFDSSEVTHGVEAEKRKRAALLSLLYSKRSRDPRQPGVMMREFERMLGCPEEHLEFPLWYLREHGLVSRADNGRHVITARGVDVAENPAEHGQPYPGRPLLAPPVR